MTADHQTRTPIRRPYVARYDQPQSLGQPVHSVNKLRKAGTALIVTLLAYASVGYGTTLSCPLIGPTIV